MFLMDCGIEMYLLVGTNVPQDILNDVFGKFHIYLLVLENN